ncbi:MAG: hypothetical protein WCC01_03340, partial [Acidimicrobiia bacterium]
LNGQDLVARHEVPSGATLEMHRTFFQWSHRTGYMINTAADDIAAGRHPWVSIKTPSWAEMAAGRHNNEIDEMLRALDRLPGPVWLTLHHEPEGGGGVNHPDDPAGPAGHVAMNRQVRERMTALGVDNVALASILMGWTWDSRSGRNPNDWWAPGIYDFIGVDHYVTKESTLANSLWYDIREWAQDHGVDVAVGEWGMRGTDAAAGRRVHEWHDEAVNSHRDGRGARVVGLAAFDSPNTWYQGVWLLRGGQLEAFHDIMADGASATPAGGSVGGSTPAPAVPAGRFVDDNGSIHEASIELIAAAGITSGCNPPTSNRYCPDATVSRGQLAAFLVRALDLPSTSKDFFSDDAGSIYEWDINRLAAAGITSGCNPPANNRYCPDSRVSRGQMAAFLVRALDLPSTSRGFFSDDAGSIFEGDINRLAAAGVTSGCNPPANNRYCPDSSVSRGQMATFLARGLDL